MRTFAVMIVKDEADIIRGTIEHLVDEVHGVYVADNVSTDGTRDILAELEREFPHHVHVSDDREPGYYQSRKMTALAGQVADACGDETVWIVPVDADELWFWQGDRICAHLAEAGDARTVQAALYNHFPSGLDAEGESPFQRIVYRQTDPGVLPKVAFRWDPNAVIHQGNHGVTLGVPGPTVREGMQVRHFPYRSLEQFITKAVNGAKAYASTDLPANVGAHWREYGALFERGGEQALREVFDRWFYFPAPVTGGLVYDPAPFKRWAAKRD